MKTIAQDVVAKKSPTPKAEKKSPKSTANLEMEIEALNKKCAFIFKSAEVVVIPTLEKPELDIYSVNKFNHVFDRVVDGKSLAHEWMKSPKRNTVYKVTYVPEGPQYIDGNLNTWVPSPIKPKKGDVSRFLAYIDHIFKNDPTHKDWFIRWAAYPIQHPGTKLNTAIVCWSKQTGNGKTTFGLIMRHIYGFHNSYKIGQKNLTETHNIWQQRKVFIYGEEIRSGISDKQADELKPMITGDTIVINPKHVQQFEIPDTINYYFTSNHDHAFYLDEADRRFFVHELPEERGSTAFWDDFYAYLDNGGYEAIYYYLLNDVDLSLPVVHEVGEKPRVFSPTAAAPQSKARKAMIEAVQDEADEWIKDLLDSPEHILNTGAPYPLALGDFLFRQFLQHNPHTRIKTNQFTSKLNASIPRLYGGNPVRIKNGTRKRIYVLVDSPKKWELLGNDAINDALALVPAL